MLVPASSACGTEITWSDGTVTKCGAYLFAPHRDKECYLHNKYFTRGADGEYIASPAPKTLYDPTRVDLEATPYIVSITSTRRGATRTFRTGA